MRYSLGDSLVESMPCLNKSLDESDRRQNRYLSPAFYLFQDVVVKTHTIEDDKINVGLAQKFGRSANRFG